MPPSAAKNPAPSHAENLHSERALIARIRERAAKAVRGSSAVRLGIGDDCAILAPPRGHEIVVTTDLSLERRHFRRDWHSARAVGHRTLARGLSDLAAMGARPLAAFLSLALPRSVAATSWLDDFLDGFLALASSFKVPLAGGDTSESPSDNVLTDIVLLGAAPTGKALRRSGARPGDRIFVTGALGGAAAELAGLSTKPHTTDTAHKRSKNPSPHNDHPHLFPQPRLAAGQALVRRRLATSCIDISDGLSTDLAHLCESSGVAAEIDAARLPLHPLARALNERALETALHGGEDYELLFTAPADAVVPKTLAALPITCIGSILRSGKSQPAMTLLEADGARSPLEPHGWEHLA